MTAVSEPAIDVDTGPDGDGTGGTTGRRPRVRALIVAAVVAVVAVLAVWVVAFSPLLGVGSVVVRGAHTVSAAQVQHVAAISPGTPLVRLDTGAIAARVETLPQVRSASVRTSFPSTVTIDVLERRPVGFVRAGGKDELVDRTGLQFRSVTARPAHLPLLVLPGNADRATTAAVAAVAASLPKALLPRVASVQALDPQAITLLMRGDRVVHWGSAAASAAKARILPVLLRRGADSIDVSDPANPFTRN
jgi:cell division protein FtsQ